MKLSKFYRSLFFDVVFLLLTFGVWLHISSFFLDCFFLFVFLFWLFLESVVNTYRVLINSREILFIVLFVLGVFAIENGEVIYLYEIDQYSGWNNTFDLAVIISYFYLRIACAFVKPPAIDIDAIPISFNRIAYNLFMFCFFIYLVISLSVIIYYKPALVLKVDRFIYDKQILGVWGQITNLGYYFCFGLGILFFFQKKIIYVFCFLFVILIFLLKGHKFGNLVDVFYFFMIPFFFLNAKKRKLKSILLLMVPSLTVFFILAISINLYLFPSFDAADYMKTRLSQEGQIWWGVAKENEYKKMHVNELISDLSITLNEDLLEKNYYDLGIYKAMRLVAPSEIIENKISKNSRYTRSAQGLFLYYTNEYFVVVIMIVFGVICGLMLKLINPIISGLSLWGSVLFCRIFYILTKVTKEAEFDKLFSVEFVFLFFMVWLVLNKKFSLKMYKTD